MKHIRIIGLLLTMCLPMVARAQMVYSIDSSEIVIGDQATLTIAGAERYPSAEQLTQNGIVAVEQWFDTVARRGAQEVLQRTRLTSFDAGEHWLKLGEADSLLLTVRDVEVDTTSMEIRDIAGLQREPYSFWEVFRWVLLVLLIAALVAGVVYVVRRVKNKKPIIALPKAPPVPADVRALKELNELRTSQLWQQGKIKEYHTRLTDIVRGYMEKSMGIQSTEMTSDETLDAFRGSRAHSGESEVLLRQVLTTADMVKFAKSEPLPHEHDRSMNDATEFVKQTAARLKSLARPMEKEVQR